MTATAETLLLWWLLFAVFAVSAKLLVRYRKAQHKADASTEGFRILGGFATVIALVLLPILPFAFLTSFEGEELFLLILLVFVSLSCVVGLIALPWIGRNDAPNTKKSRRKKSPLSETWLRLKQVGTAVLLSLLGYYMASTAFADFFRPRIVVEGQVTRTWTDPDMSAWNISKT